ncbi:hypothetical protein [Spirosoma linguale]|uniref:HEXXH motif domain-containing protein n=1 Tax=Spirosoma linguale (strain ATCC 33905 / DSM 74 / LMG 10896 / Claus 1) TaxID=504472 RepID=D2QPT9_SPILD|nr:hypothetical protein Slin_1625 [Spirosoma linguale DSM 74]
MKILKYSIPNKEFYNANQSILSDTIRMAMYQSDPTLFELLDYDNDSIFLEPTLFCHFLSDIDKAVTIPLTQCLVGYISNNNRPDLLTVRADRFGLINLPNLGYIRANPFEPFTINSAQLTTGLIPNQSLPNSTIRLCWHPTDLLGHRQAISFYESVEVTAKKYQKPLFQAVHFFQTKLPDFWQLIESVTREFVVFSSPPEHHSFAGIMHHGTAYFNVENKPQTPVFFIDDIAHQCGHVIFNALTLDTETYLHVAKDFPINEFTKASWDTRTVYGAFHGLFTYTTILHSMDSVLEATSALSKVLQHEALGRIGFYIYKFNIDLTNMNNPSILTEAGMDYHRQFAAGYAYIYQKYQSALAGFKYSNQPYTFQYDLFALLNPLPKTPFA